MSQNFNRRITQWPREQCPVRRPRTRCNQLRKKSASPERAISRKTNFFGPSLWMLQGLWASLFDLPGIIWGRSRSREKFFLGVTVNLGEAAVGGAKRKSCFLVRGQLSQGGRDRNGRDQLEGSLVGRGFCDCQVKGPTLSSWKREGPEGHGGGRGYSVCRKADRCRKGGEEGSGKGRLRLGSCNGDGKHPEYSVEKKSGRVGSWRLRGAFLWART